jgi:hypothetical protein
MAKVAAKLFGCLAASVLYFASSFRKHEVEPSWAFMSAALFGDVGDT